MSDESKKLKFYTMKHTSGRKEGMFIAPDEEAAKEIALKNDFKVPDDAVFEDINLKENK